MKQRNDYLDVIKGLAISLVVVAHCVQWGSGEAYHAAGLFFSNALFKFIYGFHMPLFMAVSGFLFWGTVNRHAAGEVVRSRLVSLLLPVVSWQTLYLSCLLLSGGIVLSVWLLPTYLGALWFLWSVFISSVLVLLGHIYGRDSLWYYAIVWMGLLLLPDRVMSGVHVFMYPYFVAGYLWNKYACQHRYGRWSQRTRWVVLLLALVLFVGFYVLYDVPERSVYLNGTTLLGRPSPLWQAGTDAMRYAYGFAGVVMVMVLTELLMPWLRGTRVETVMVALGRNTLGIYIVNYYTTQCLLYVPVNGVNYAVTLIESILMTALGYGVMRLLTRNRWLGLILFGKR